MNRIFRLVFNRALGQVQVVSELASAHRVRGVVDGRRMPRLAMLAVLLAMAGGAHAQQVSPDQLPTGANVGGGIASITVNGNTMDIAQSGDRGLIRWDSFDVGSNATVNIHQLSHQVLLNYILDGDASQIMGDINAGGTVFLMNPNGLIFGAGAQINVGSLVASTLVMDDPDAVLQAGGFNDLLLRGPAAPAAVVNRGAIEATRDVHLIGGAVDNTGVIQAGRQLGLTAASQVGLGLQADGYRTTTQAATSSGSSSSAIANTGTLQGGHVQLQASVAGGTFSRTINTSGVVAATGFDGVPGQVTLTGRSLGGTPGMTVGRVEAADVAIDNVGAVALQGAIDADTLQIGAGGAVTQDTGNGNALSIDNGLTVTRATSVSLANVGNTLGGTTVLRHGGDATINATGNVAIGGTDTSPFGNNTLDVARLRVTSSGDITIGAGMVGNTLALEADGGISQAQTGPALTVLGTSNLSAGGAITLDNAGNVFGGIVDIDAAAATLEAAGLLRIGSANVDGALSVGATGALELGNTFAGALDARSNGNISQTGDVRVTGTSALRADGSVVLDRSGNQFGNAVVLEVDGDASIRSQGILALGVSEVGGNLIAQAGGTLSQTGGISVDGTSDLRGNAIDLSNPANSFGGAVSMTSAGYAGIATGGSLRLGSVSASALSAQGGTIYLPQAVTTLGGQSYSGGLVLEGDTVLTSNIGGLSLNGTLDGPHALTLDARATVHLGATADIDSLTVRNTPEARIAANIVTAGDIELLGNTTVYGNHALTSTGGDVTIGGVLNGYTDNNDSLSINATRQVALQAAVGNAERLRNLSLTGDSVSTMAMHIGGDLSIDSAADIHQGGAYEIGGAAHFASDGDITLTHSQNQFGGDVALDGNAVQITAEGPLSLSDVDATTLLANAGGLLTLRDATVAASTTLTGDAVRLDDVSLGTTASVVATGGHITQQGALRVDGTSSWTAAGDISLADPTNLFGGAVTASGANISLATSTALNLANVDALGQGIFSGNGVHLGSVHATGLAVQSSAGITQGNALNLGAGSRFAAVGDVVLDNAGNVFGGGVQLAGRHISIGSASGLTLDGVDATGNLSATALGGNLQQTNVIHVQGRSDLRAGGGVQLGNTGNRFGGPVAVQGQSILLRADGDLDIESVRNGSNGAVQLLATGDIDVAGDAIDTGSSVLAVISDAGQVRTATALRGGQVSIGGVEGIRIGGDITASRLSLTATRGDVLQQSGRIQSGDALLSSGQGDLRLDSVDNLFNGVTTLYGRHVDVAAGELLLGEVITSGDLRLDSGGSIHQQARLVVAGQADLRAAGDITLTHADNDFVGTLDLQGGAVAVSDRNALTLGTVNADALTVTSHGALDLGQGRVEGALIARSNGDEIEQSGALTVGGSADIGAGSGYITLVQSDNVFGGTVRLQGHDIEISGGDLDLAAVAAGGTLALTSTGAITQQGAVQVAGTSRFDAAGGVTLTHVDNVFGGAVSLAGDAATLHHADALRLGTLDVASLDVASQGALDLGGGTIDGKLIARSNGGDIIQSGALAIGGTSDIGAGSGNVSLTWANTFGGPVTVQGHAIELVSAGDLHIADLRSGDDARVQVSAEGDLQLDGSAVDTGSADLTLLANAGVLRTGTAVAGHNVVLAGYDGVAIGGDVTSAAGLVLASMDADITQLSGRIQVGGDLLAIAGSGDIALVQADNRFEGTLTLRGGDIAVAGGDLDLADVTAAGDLSLTGTGAITQQGAVNVSGSSDLTAVGGITLVHEGNEFGGPVSLTGGAVAIRDADALTLGTLDVASLDVASNGALDLGTGRIGGALLADSNGGAITQSGALSVAGTSTLDAGTGGITLDDAGNDFVGAVDASGAGISLRDANDLVMSRVAATGDGDIRLVAGRALTLPTSGIDAGNGGLQLTALGGALVTQGALAGGDISLQAANGITLGHDVDAARALSLTAGGDIVQSGGRIAAGTLTGSTSGAMQLGGANRIASVDALSASSIRLANATSLSIDGAVDAGSNLQLAVDGDLAIDGRLAATAIRLDTTGGIQQSAGSQLVAQTLSGRAGGAVSLGGAAGFIDNRVERIGDFSARSGFSMTNGRSLMLGALNGSDFTIDAGTSDFFISVDGDLLQDRTHWLYNGRGTWAASGAIGRAASPIYVTGLETQTVSALGEPPAYFYAVRPDGTWLPVEGAPSVAVSGLGAVVRAQVANSRVTGRRDPGDIDAGGADYRVSRRGVRLPDDQLPQCDAHDGSADCTDTQ